MTSAEQLKAKARQSEEGIRHLSEQKKSKSWQEHVVVFIESNDDLYITPKANIKDLGKPRATLTIPWVRNEKTIFVSASPTSENNGEPGQYVATVKLSKVLKGHRIQRLFGLVKSLYVYE